MKGYPGLTNLLTEQNKMTKKRLVTKQWCEWARTLMNYFNNQYLMGITELHNYIFYSYIVYEYWW